MDIGLGQKSSRISGGRDKMRARMGQFTLGPVLQGLAKISIHPSLIHSGPSPKPCTKHTDLLYICPAATCVELCPLIEGTEIAIARSEELVKASFCFYRW